MRDRIFEIHDFLPIELDPIKFMECQFMTTNKQYHILNRFYFLWVEIPFKTDFHEYFSIFTRDWLWRCTTCARRSLWTSVISQLLVIEKLQQGLPFGVNSTFLVRTRSSLPIAAVLTDRTGYPTSPRILFYTIHSSLKTKVNKLHFWLFFSRASTLASVNWKKPVLNFAKLSTALTTRASRGSI